jgi:hypothetical protein
MNVMTMDEAWSLARPKRLDWDRRIRTKQPDWPLSLMTDASAEKKRGDLADLCTEAIEFGRLAPAKRER